MKLQDAAERALLRILRRAAAIPALRKRCPGPWSADVRVVSKLVMAKLNLKYRRKNKPTDVLSFESPKVFRKLGVLGSLVICGPVLKAQAKEFGQSEQRELDLLVAHGVLHLLGMDHEASTQDARAMARYESKLLDRRGLVGRSTA